MLSLILRKIATTFYKVEAEALLNEVSEILRVALPSEVVDSIIEALIVAEDHRFLLHKGVDYRSILRALFVIVFAKRIEGGSTITQQLTRVITGDFRKSVNRKFKEICVAAWLDSKVPKREQAVAYLHVGYFGWRMKGCAQAARRLGIELPCNARCAAAIIARLKYPEPRNPSEIQFQRIQRRMQHIVAAMERNK